MSSMYLSQISGDVRFLQQSWHQYSPAPVFYDWLTDWLTDWLKDETNRLTDWMTWRPTDECTYVCLKFLARKYFAHFTKSLQWWLYPTMKYGIFHWLNVLPSKYLSGTCFMLLWGLCDCKAAVIRISLVSWHCFIAYIHIVGVFLVPLEHCWLCHHLLLLLRPMQLNVNYTHAQCSPWHLSLLISCLIS